MSDSKSAVEFPTAARPHIAFAASDLAASTEFYRRLFGKEPTKVKPDYVKFEVFEPPLNLTLNQSKQVAVSPAPEHFGIQVKSTEEVSARATRMTEGGYSAVPEDNVTCCYAVQDKVWVTDPDGRRWEVFVVLDPATEEHSLPTEASEKMSADGEACCAPQATSSCCP